MRLAKERLRNLMPRLLRQERAATYIDTCVPTFLGLVKAKVLPPPKQLSKNIEAWDRDELDRTIDCLPFSGAGAADTTWDD
jgi:predicted DNA-binding transcriptional regulator AlpA